MNSTSPLPSLIWGSPGWVGWAIGLIALGLFTIVWSYFRARAKPSVRGFGIVLKGIGLTALVLALLEPLLTGSRPRKGANAFVVLADNSQSLLIKDDQSTTSRGDWVREILKEGTPWSTRLAQDFDVRRYAFDTHLRGVDKFDALAFDGTGSALSSSLAALAKRFKGLPLAGVLIMTDGNGTDLADIDLADLPPIFPVIPPSRGVMRDVSVTNVAVTQSNFESAPVVLRADVTSVGVSGEPVVAVVTDEAGKEVERQELKPSTDGKPLGFRFQFRPETRGIRFYQVNAFASSDEKATRGEGTSTEQTLANNSRLVVVDQGGGPYRVLYVSGRPNWEFKFLRRAESEDDQVQLVGLIRIARRQPKFDFRDPRDRANSALFEGFDHPDPDSAERADQPVLVRLGTLDEVELRDGFPKTADELYRYHAIVIDDLEAGFFTQDQLALVRNFVSVRGGGLLMLGGPDSFFEGKYDHTPVGDLLPVYVNRPAANPVDEDFRLLLTREGWLQPWVRTRKTEDDEKKRLDAMPAFETLSQVSGVKPGAVVLSEVRNASGAIFPALVAQQFGKGHVGALLIGDLWRWAIRRANPTEDDLDRSWRQTVRWLVGDVPGRVDLSTGAKADNPSAVAITARVRDAEYRPLDNAKVSLKLTLPGGDPLTLEAEASGTEAGTYVATYVPKTPGAYRVTASATAADGSAVGEREAGWAAQPSADEFARLEPNRPLLASIATKTRGEIVEGDRLASFVGSLGTRDAPVTEPWTSPLWHNPLYFLVGHRFA